MNAKVLNFPADLPPTFQVVTSRYVTIELAATMTGYSPAAIRSKIAKGEWLQDRQYVRRDGRVLIDIKGYEKWAEMGRA